MRAVLLIAGAVFFVLCKHGPLAGVVNLPESRRQIPAEVFGGSLVRGAYRFGLELGTGVRTYVPSPAPYILLLAVFLGRLTLADALLVGLGFGVGRAVPLMVQLIAASQVRKANPFFRRAGAAAFGDSRATYTRRSINSCLKLRQIRHRKPRLSLDEHAAYPAARDYRSRQHFPV